MVFVIDCNVWVSLAINKQLFILANAVDQGHSLVTCERLITEIEEVISRPKFRKLLPSSYVKGIIEFHATFCELHAISNIKNIVTDQKDNYLFALADKTKADYLVTGDKLLLNVKRYQKTELLTLAVFKALLNK